MWNMSKENLHSVLPSKRSERLRIKSAKGSVFSTHGKEFVYDLGDLDPPTEINPSAVDGRPRAGSWSAGTSGGAAIVERRLQKSKTPSKLVDPTTPKTTKSEESGAFKRRQKKLKQKRIDLLFLQQRDNPFDVENDGYREIEEDKEVYFKDNRSLHQQVSTGIKVSIADNPNSEESETSSEIRSNKRRLAYTAGYADYGSDFESVSEHSFIGCPSKETPLKSINLQNSKHFTAEEQEKPPESQQPAEVESESELLCRGKQNQNMSLDIDPSAPLTVAHWEKLLSQMKTTVETEVAKLIKVETVKFQEEVGSLSSKHTSIENELETVKKDLSLCKNQLKDVMGVCIKQQHELGECKDHLDTVLNKLDNNVVKISGVEEHKDEKCIETVQNFLKTKVLLKKSIAINEAFRVGNKEAGNRLIVVHLQNARDKGLIFANAKNLKDLTNKEGNPYRVFDQMTAKKKAKRNRRRQLFHVNESMDAELKRNMKWERGDLYIDGKPYEQKLKAPSCREILGACKVLREERLGKELTKGPNKVFQGQEFIGYTVAVKSIEEANQWYVKIRSVHTDARHLICACRVVGRSFHTSQDFVDDDEHGAGNILLEMLLESQIQNRALFVVRNYDGTHIGAKRFDLIKQAAKSAIDRAPVNSITGLHDCVWNSDIETNPNTTFNKTRGRGGRGGGGNRGGYKGVTKADRAEMYLHGAIRRPGTPGSPTFAEIARQTTPDQDESNQDTGQAV